MATKSTRKSTIITSTRVSSQDAQARASTSPERPSSPLSPTRHSRLLEKAELQNLNDRLAVYIDRVRHLETENSRLSREVQTTQETITREVTNIKSMYEQELSDARKLLDETAKERAKLELDVKRLWEENDDLKIKLDKKTKDLVTAEKNATLYENRAADLSNKYNQAQAERKKAAEELKEVEKERDRLQKLVDELRKHLEEETLARVDLENNVQSLKEELSFKEQIYQQELTETRTRRQVEISELDGRLTEQYEAKLQESLQELRDQYEAQMRANREEIELLYENKIRDLRNQAQRNSGAAAAAVEELRQSRSRMDSMSNRVTELEATNNALQARIRDLEKLLESERLRYAEQMQTLEEELQRMREEMATQLQEYQDLMDIKVALDLEIGSYRKLLESEEARLNITPMQSPQSARMGRSTPIRRGTPLRSGGKRRKILEETEETSQSDYIVMQQAKGDIAVDSTDPQGKFIKIKNKSNKEVSLSGWQILRKAGTEEASYKFHRMVKLEANGTITVWSSDAGQTHEPPHNLVMKGQKWVVGDSMTTTIHNNAGEEVAIYEQRKQQLSTSSLRHRETSSGFAGHRSLEVGSEELFHQQGDPQGEERCRLM